MEYGQRGLEGNENFWKERKEIETYQHKEAAATVLRREYQQSEECSEPGDKRRHSQVRQRAAELRRKRRRLEFCCQERLAATKSCKEQGVASP